MSKKSSWEVAPIFTFHIDEDGNMVIDIITASGYFEDEITEFFEDEEGEE